MTQERNERDARIVKRAAEIWSEEGGPMNSHEAQWLTAMRQIDDEDRDGRAASSVQASTGIPGLESQIRRETLDQFTLTVADDETSGRVASRIGAVTKAASRFFSRL